MQPNSLRNIRTEIKALEVEMERKGWTLGTDKENSDGGNLG